MDANSVIREFIVSRLIPEAESATVVDSDLLVQEGIIDSFGIMALLGFLEDRFSIVVGGDELVPENFESIASISALVLRKTARQEELA